MRRKPQEAQQPQTSNPTESITSAASADVKTQPNSKRRIPGQDCFEYLATIENEDWARCYLYLSRQGSGHVKGDVRLEDFKRAITYKELFEEILPKYGPGTYVLQFSSTLNHVQSTREVVSFDIPTQANSKVVGTSVVRGSHTDVVGTELPDQIKAVASTVRELKELFPQQSDNNPMMAFLLDRLTKAEERNQELMMKLIEQKTSEESDSDPLSMLEMLDALDKRMEERMEARLNRTKEPGATADEHPAVTIGKYAAPFLAAMVAPHVNKVMSWATAGQTAQPVAPTSVQPKNGHALQEPKFTEQASTDPNQAVIELVANLKEVFRRGEHTDENAPNFWSAYIQRLLPPIAQWIARRKTEETMQTLMSIDGEFAQLLQQEEIREFVQGTIEKVKAELTAN